MLATTELLTVERVGDSMFITRGASHTSVFIDRIILQPLILRQLVEEAAGAVGLRGQPGKLQCGAGPEQLDH